MTDEEATLDGDPGPQRRHLIALSGGPWADWPRWWREGAPPMVIAVRTGPERGAYQMVGRTVDGRALLYVWHPQRARAAGIARAVAGPRVRDRLPPTSARNAAMFAAYASGTSSKELAETYGISAVRVRKIIAAARDHRNQETRSARRPDLISPSQVGGRAYTALRIAGITRWSQLAGADEHSLAHIPRIGPALAAVILAARDRRRPRP